MSEIRENIRPYDGLLEQIRSDTADCFSVSVADMLGMARGNNLLCARSAFVKILRDEFDFSLPYIGSLLNRDHTSTIHYLKRHESFLEKNSTYKEKYDNLNITLQKKFGEQIQLINQDLRRSNRSRDELPDPTKPGDASVNRNDALFSARVEKTVLEAVEEFRRKSGMTKKAIAEAALLSFIEKNEAESEP